MEDKKTYSIIGKVEIGTDEYRDLIEEAKEQEKSAEYYRNKYWSEQTASQNKDKEIKKLQAELEKLQNIIKTTTTINVDNSGVGDFQDLLNALLGE